MYKHGASRTILRHINALPLAYTLGSLGLLIIVFKGIFKKTSIDTCRHTICFVVYIRTLIKQQFKKRPL